MTDQRSGLESDAPIPSRPADAGYLSPRAQLEELVAADTAAQLVSPDPGMLARFRGSGVGQFVIRRPRSAALALVMAVLVGITGFSVLTQDVIPALEGMGYVGIFAVGLLGTGAMVIPAVTLPMAFALGGLPGYSAVLIGLAGAAGETLGSVVGYRIGRGARGGLERIRGFGWVQRQLQQRGIVAVFLISLVPNPLVKVTTLAAGAAHMPLLPFLLASAAGKFVKFSVAAWIGAVGVAFVFRVLGLPPPGG